MVKKTNEEFLCELAEKDIKYRPLELYQSGKRKIAFSCEKHGSFKMRPQDILNGYGCPVCGGTKKTSPQEFIEKAKTVHNNFFTYEKCNYINSNLKVIITCPIHGDFEQKANNHLNGQNCPKCSKEKIKHKINLNPLSSKSTKKLTQETFLTRARNIHGDKYDYSTIEYQNFRTKVNVTCKEHGGFTIFPQHFLQGQGCPKCANNKQLTTKEFILKSKEIHGNRYKYDKTIYTNTHGNVIITCLAHGDFEQMPSNHLQGQGCPRCKQSLMENNIAVELIQLGIEFKQQEKIDKYYLDFYLPSQNIAIECQGIQHFEPIDYFGGKEGYIKQIERDEEKRKLCKEKDIKLLYYTTLKQYIDNTEYLDKETLLNYIKNYGNS